MYDEIVTRLRDAAKMSESLAVLLPHSEGNVTAKLYNGAADAIEELQKACEEAYSKGLLEGGLAQRAEDEKWLPKWIPATERLPEDAYACLAIVWDNNSYTGNTFLNYYPEFVGYGGGSWNDYNGDEIPFEVVYWMKLPQIPELPKEEH